MAANATAVWRARPSGSNTNGGGFDCSISAAATGSNGNFSGTTFTDSVASAFTSGMVGSAINIANVGQYLISTFINSQQITLSSGNPAMTLVGPLTWTVGSGQDYSQQNAAQLTQSGGTVTTSTTTLTDTGASFTTALIGNGIRVAGTSITTTITFITAVPSSTTLTLQTSPGTAGTAVTYNIGGGWADPYTNCTTTAPTIVSGNIMYVLGSGTPNPSSYTVDYSVAPSTNNYVSGIRVFNDPATPGFKAAPDTTGGMPVIKNTATNSLFNSQNNGNFQGLWVLAGAATVGYFTSAGSQWSAFGCVMDESGFDAYTMANGQTNCSIIGCEIWNSGGGAAGAGYAIGTLTSSYVTGCNIHDLRGPGILMGSGTVMDTIVAKCGATSYALAINGSGAPPAYIINCTIDGNGGDAIEIQNDVDRSNVFNNIISNHTGAGKFALNVSGTQASNDRAKMLIDYNSFYNNTSNYTGISPGPHDTILSTTPYVASSTENYTLA